jgi:hypothetical protein
MRRLIRALMPLGSVLLAVSMLSTGTAYATTAAAGVAASEGSGFISPGLTTTPTFQTNSFTGTIAGVGLGIDTGTTQAAVSAFEGDQTVPGVSYSGSSTIAEDAALGKGSGTVTVNAPTCVGVTVLFPLNTCVRVTAQFAVTYQRVGPVVLVTGNGALTVYWSGGGTIHVSADFQAACVFVPTTVNPTTSFDLACQAVIDPIPLSV